VNRCSPRAERPFRQTQGEPPVAGRPFHAHVRASGRDLPSRPLRRGDQGATAVEYALIIGLIAAVIFGTVAALGQAVLGLFTAPLGGF
jgi:Flp pilus assembly pilin Flp